MSDNFSMYWYPGLGTSSPNAPVYVWNGTGWYTMNHPAAEPPRMLQPKKKEPAMNSRECLGILQQMSLLGTNDLNEGVAWMVTPHPQLGMRQPVDCDYREVRDVINEAQKKSA